MYDLDSLKRRIKKYGVTRIIEELSHTRFNENVMKQLEKANIFIDGDLNVSLIRSLSD